MASSRVGASTSACIQTEQYTHVFVCMDENNNQMGAAARQHVIAAAVSAATAAHTTWFCCKHVNHAPVTGTYMHVVSNGRMPGVVLNSCTDLGR